MYYNPTTDTKLTREELCNKYNCSIPKSNEHYNGWYRLQKGSRPTPNAFQNVVENKVEMIDDKYVITYDLEYKPFDEVKNLRLQEIERKFDSISDHAHVMSSCGFMIDANEKAHRDIEGLIKINKAEGAETELFRDYNNEYHSVTLEQLETMQIEVIKNGQNIYKQKWFFEHQLEICTTVEELVAVNIEYENMNFLTE